MVHSDLPKQHPGIDVFEHGAAIEGAPQNLDQRLFMQLLVLRCEGAMDAQRAARTVADRMEDRHLAGVVYAHLNDPDELGLLTWSEDPSHFVRETRPLVASLREQGVRPQPAFTMLGRTYSTGYEPNLAHTLLRRPIENATNPSWPWAVWYPLRRRGSFERLEGRERGAILGEHARIGMAYGRADLAHDIRLACHGLDPHDNDFVVGLVSSNLHRLSHVVQAMRATRQTAEYMDRMGPFFVGHAVWQSAGELR